MTDRPNERVVYFNGEIIAESRAPRLVPRPQLQMRRRRVRHRADLWPLPASNCFAT
jgi:hypothetical protein